MSDVTGQQMIAAADEIEREHKRWENLRASAAWLREAGSMKAAADRIERTLAEAKVRQEQEMAVIEQRRKDAEAQIADVEAHQKETTAVLDAAKADVDEYVQQQREAASRIISQANAEAARIKAEAQVFGEKQVEELLAQHTGTAAELDQHRQALETLNSEIEARQAVLDDLDAKLEKIKGARG